MPRNELSHTFEAQQNRASLHSICTAFAPGAPEKISEGRVESELSTGDSDVLLPCLGALAPSCLAMSFCHPNVLADLGFQLET